MYVDYAVKLLRRRILSILFVGLAGFAVANAYVMTMQSYVSASYLLLQPTAAQAGARAVQPDRFVKTAGQRVLSDAVLGRAAQTLAESPETLRAASSLSGGAADDVLELLVRGKTADESQRRMKAVLSELAARPATEVTTEVLWTSGASSVLPRSRVLAAGFIGGVLLRSILVLGWGAATRPVLSSDRVLRPDVEVRTLRSGSQRSSGDPLSPSEEVSELAGWIDARQRRGRPHEILTDDLAAEPATRGFVHSLAEQAPAGVRVRDLRSSLLDAEVGHDKCARTIVFVGIIGITTEGQVERRRRLAEGLGDSYVLVLVDGSRK